MAGAEIFRFLVISLAALQALLMLVDEGYFHRKRGLGTFERYGHVVDTLAFVLALLIPALFPPEKGAIYSYGALALFSSLLITKDEWIHAKACDGLEQWCHAMLFLLHGVLLISVGFLWVYERAAIELKPLPLGAFLWAIYQHTYWNVYDRRRHQ